MLRKRDISEGSVGASPRTGSEMPEGRMSATGTSGYEVKPVPERGLGTDVGAKAREVGGRVREGAAVAGERVSEAGRTVARKAVEVKDITAERLGRAGEVVGEAAREVQIEDFLLRGSVAGHPFRLELEGEGQEKFFAFEVDLRTDDGDIVHISGRKRLNMMGEGPEVTTEGALEQTEIRGETRNLGETGPTGVTRRSGGI